MRFGIMVMPQHPSTDSPVKRFRETVELTRIARDAGLDGICAGHHYLSPPYQNLQHLPLLARLAADSGDMDVILSIVLLAILNPVEVAENVASLDVITEGRAVFGIGLGYRGVEYQAFNVEVKDRVPRMYEGLDLIRRLWTEDNVTFQGRFFNLTDATCTIRPVQKPHPPIWVATNSDGATERIGAQGFPWFVNPHAALPTLENQAKLYEEAAAKAGTPLPDTRPILKEMHVAETREEAIRIAQPYLAGKYQRYADWGQDKVLPGEESFRIPFEELSADGRFIVGSVDDVIHQIELHRDRLGIDYFLFRIWWPGMEAYHAYRVVEILAERIIPHFRKSAA